MARLRFIAFVLAVFFAATSAAAKELWERRWIEVRSAHFVIVSTVAEQRTVELARDLERFRSAVQILTNIGRFEERIPTKVYVLPHADKKLGFKGSIKGYFWPKMRANYAAVVPGANVGLDDVLKHEYMHFLVHNRDTLSYPTWFDEGFAEVFQTLTTRGDRIDYGQPTRVWVDWLANHSWLPLDQLLDTRDIFKLSAASRAMFYAQSWVLMHYLMFGREDGNFGVEATSFLKRVESGAGSSDAFEQAFGIPVSKLRDTLVKYVSGELRDMSLSNQSLPDAPTEVVPVAADSIAAQLGLLAWQFGEFDEAKRYWDPALVLNPNNTLALAGLGGYHKRAGRLDEAQRYYEKALALEPQNAHAELDYGEYFLDRARAAKNSDEIATNLTEARRHFARSYQLDPQDPETLAMIGASYLPPGGSPDKALESLTAAHEMLPSQAQIKYLLALAYVMSGESAKAEPLLRSIIAWGQEGPAGAASKLRQQLSNAKALDRPVDAGQPPIAE